MSLNSSPPDNAAWNPFGFTTGCKLKAKTTPPITAIRGGFTIHVRTGMRMERIWQEGGEYVLKVRDPDNKLCSGVFKARDFELDDPTC